MYPAWTNPDATRTYQAPERNSSYSSREVRTYGQPQTAALPPRPLEPRPTLQTSHSEPSILPRSQDTYAHPDGPGPGMEYRSRGQNLPGLKDILNPPPYSPSRQSYSSAWTIPGNANNHADPESYPIPNGIHPPMVLHPPTTANQRYQSHLGKPYDLPISEPNRQPLLALSSSHPGFPEAGREYPEPISERLKELSTSSLLPSGIPSPYRPQDESQFRGQPGSSYRQGRPNHLGSGAESYGRYLGIEDIAGEGKFHVYADGSRIPTQVDGEQVNPQWGLTKANKPRKRLALACLDCREKKIKCEPGVSSCIQCEKAMRPCRRPPEKYLPGDTPTNTLWIAGSPVRKSATESDTTTNSSIRDAEADFLSKRRVRADQSPPMGSNKRPRSGSPPLDRVHRIDSLRRDDTSPTDAARSYTLEDPREDSLLWENDPYAVEPDLTLYLVELYFNHINNATYCMFPRRHFLHWLKTCSIKCQNERMLLYSMLAVATVFADDRLAGIGKQCAQISREAIASEVGRYNVSNAASKMLLALYHFAKGVEPLAWEYVGSAIRTVTYMNLNTESGCNDDSVSRRQPRYDFQFTAEQLAECKRRTFWSCFIQDRYCAPTMCMLKPQDIFVRLPASDEIYEQATLPSKAPYFANDILEPVEMSADATRSLAPLASLVLVAGLWGDVIDCGHRASNQPDSTYAYFYEKSYAQLQSRLRDWHAHLPEYLQFSAANLDRSIRGDYVGTFISIHTLYHLTLLKLNRYMRHAVIPQSVSRNIRTANHHGHQILQIMTALHLARKDMAASAEVPSSLRPFTTPFPGYAVLLAVDTVSAGGLDSNLRTTLDEIDGALGCLRDLEQHWSNSKSQLKACQKRFYQLQNVTTSPKHAKSGCWLGRKWGIKGPLEPEYSAENDCIYGLGEKDADEAQLKYYDAFKDD